MYILVNFILQFLPQRRLWLLGTSQANYHSQSTPKKKCTKLLEYTQKYNHSQLLTMMVTIATYSNNNSIFKKLF